jgi:Tfp pilus assembly protein PilX
MLMIVMVGIAATVILSTQQDLSVAGQDREQQQAFYAAEYAIAQAKDYLEKQVPTTIPNIANFTSSGSWTTLLQAVNTAGVPQACSSGPTNLPATPISPSMGWQDYNGPTGVLAIPSGSNQHVMWRYCIHNNAEDMAYLDSAGNANGTNTVAASSGCAGISAPTGGGVGDNCDWRDPMHLITIEAWGAFPVDAVSKTPLPGAAYVHLAANIGPPQARTQDPLVSGYSQEGGLGSHNNNGGSTEGGSIDTTVVR